LAAGVSAPAAIPGSELVAKPIPAQKPKPRPKPIRIDAGRLDDVVDRVVVATACGYDVRYASALDGRVDIHHHAGDCGYLGALRDCIAAVASRVLHPESCRAEDVRRAEEIANSVCGSTREAQAFLDLACLRVESLGATPRFWDAHQAVRDKLVAAGGASSNVFKAPRTDPIVIEPVFNIATPAPIVNISPAPFDAPVVNVNVPPPADKVVEF
jgi:hypothetical protein